MQFKRLAAVCNVTLALANHGESVTLPRVKAWHVEDGSMVAVVAVNNCNAVNGHILRTVVAAHTEANDVDVVSCCDGNQEFIALYIRRVGNSDWVLTCHTLADCVATSCHYFHIRSQICHPFFLWAFKGNLVASVTCVTR